MNYFSNILNYNLPYLQFCNLPQIANNNSSFSFIPFNFDSYKCNFSWNSNPLVQQFNIPAFNFDYKLPDFTTQSTNFFQTTFPPIFSWNNNFNLLPMQNMPVLSTLTSSIHTPITRKDNDFDKMLAQVLKFEGGLNPNDNGSASNKGVKQETYDAYRTRKGFPKQDVRNITDAEVRDIYYNDYYLASGADKIEDARLAFYLFDTSINMGVRRAKQILAQSNNNPDKFMELRLARYESLAASNPDLYGDDLASWKNRIASCKSFVGKEFVA